MPVVKWSPQKFIDTIKPYIDDSLKDDEEAKKKSQESFNKLFAGQQGQQPTESSPMMGEQGQQPQEQNPGGMGQ